MIVILNSPLFREKNPLYDEDSLPPLGLGYIATNLENKGFEVQLIDAVYQQIPFESLLSTLNHIKPEYLAINIFTTNYDIVKDLVEAIKFRTHIIIGGLSTKGLHSEIVGWKTNNLLDIVIGDGELITSDIINNTLNEKPFISRKKRRVFKVFGNSKYFVKDISDVPLNRNFFLNEPIKHPFKFQEANIIASRGCIYNCTFCAAARSLNKEYPIRERSVASIKSELNDIKLKYPKVSSIRVLDDLFLKNTRSLETAIEVFRSFDFKWRSMAHVMTFQRADETLMRKLKESGCNELFIGIESGSPQILKSINKTSNTSVIIRNSSKVLKAGIGIKGYFIYGFPEESREDMQMTYKLACELKKIAIKYGSNFRTSVFQYRPYHATEIYHSLISEGNQLIVENISPNKQLSDLVGRIQFNFHSGNYSKVALSLIHDYIYRTTNLTDTELFSGIRPAFRSKISKKL